MKNGYQHFYKELFLLLITPPTPQKRNLTAKINSEEKKLGDAESCSSNISYYYFPSQICLLGCTTFSVVQHNILHHERTSREGRYIGVCGQSTIKNNLIELESTVLYSRKTTMIPMMHCSRIFELYVFWSFLIICLMIIWSYSTTCIFEGKQQTQVRCENICFVKKNHFFYKIAILTEKM